MGDCISYEMLQTDKYIICAPKYISNSKNKKKIKNRQNFDFSALIQNFNMHLMLRIHVYM